jgi:hypothetical protein
MSTERTLHEALASHGCHSVDGTHYGCRVVMRGDEVIGEMTAAQGWIFVRTLEMGDDQ